MRAREARRGSLEVFLPRVFAGCVPWTGSIPTLVEVAVHTSRRSSGGELW